MKKVCTFTGEVRRGGPIREKKQKQKILRFNSNYRNPDEDKPGIAVKKNVKNKSNCIEHTFLTTHKPNKYTSESLQSLEKKSTFVCPEEGSGNGRYVDA